MATDITPLDLAWEQINALGGSKPSTYDDYGRGIIYAVDRALEIIEELGGSNPAFKRNASPSAA